MRDELTAFISQPNLDTYLAVREFVIASDHYEPYSDEMSEAGALYEDEKPSEARDVLCQAMANLILSPRAHHMLGFLQHKLGDEEAAQMEWAFGQACLTGLMATGDGSRDAPFLVTRTSDEYDIIEQQEKELKSQTLVHDEDRHLDVLECSGGSKVWFDITTPYNHLAKTFKD